MRVGELEVRIVSGGAFKLDGGGMFGVVPKPLWSRAFEPDARNRIALDANCVLVRTPDELVLIDTGNGSKLGEKERDIFDLAPGNALLDNLAGAGVRPEEITTVLLTHLHMDHAGGASHLEGDRPVASFPKARVVVQQREWEDACANRSHMRVSYRAENLRPLEESGRLQLLDGDAEVAPGVEVRVTGGHTPGHHCVLLRSGGETALLPADICPTVAHLRPAYNMAYDLAPYETLQVKAELLEQAAREGWLVIFDHEPVQKAVRLRLEGGNLVPEAV
ncbi:MAG: MBL fold metallo-hydrolase [Armatimonadota bacterium]